MSTIYGSPLFISGSSGGKNDTLPPLLDNFQATAKRHLLSDLPSGTKIKLGRYSNNTDQSTPQIAEFDLIWVTTKNKQGTTFLVLSTDTVQKEPFNSMVFDAEEPRNSVSSRKTGGNSRYVLSNIHQWLNGKVGSWEATHPNDEFPAYSNFDKFSQHWTDKERSVLQNKSWTVDKSSADGGGTEKFEALFVLPSREEVGLDGSNYLDIFIDNNSRIIPGHYWALRTPNADARIYDVAENGTSSNWLCKELYAIRPICCPNPNVEVTEEPDEDGCYRISNSEETTITISADKMQESRATDLAGAVWVYSDHEPKNMNDGTKIELDRNDIISSELGLSLTLRELPPSDANHKVIVNIPESDGKLHPYLYLTNDYNSSGKGCLLKYVVNEAITPTGTKYEGGNFDLACQDFKNRLASSVRKYIAPVTIYSWNSGTGGKNITREIFLLSQRESGGGSDTYIKQFPFFNVQANRIAKDEGGAARGWWCREFNNTNPSYVNYQGVISSTSGSQYFRPAVTMSLDLPLSPTPKKDGSYDFLDVSKDKAKLVKETEQTVGNLPSKSKVKLGRYNGNELTWLTTKDAEGRQYLRLDSGCVAWFPFQSMIFDNNESNNTDTNIVNNGNNLFTLSNLFQWLNSDKSANNWYAAQHAYDAPPPYANQDGFLKGWTAQEKQILLNRVWEVRVPSSVSSSLIEFTAKVVLPSTTEMGLENNTGGSRLDIFNSSADRIINGSPWWSRNSEKTNTHQVVHPNYNGNIVSSNCNREGIQVVPLVSIPINTPVELGSDGSYHLLLDMMLPKVKSSITYSKEKDFYARQFTYNAKNQYQTMLEGAIATVNDTPPEPQGQKITELSSKSKVKLGRYNDTVLKWIVCRDSVDNSVRLILDTSSVGTIGHKMFDNKEPSNSNANRKGVGNNRYIWSNIHQWLNTNKTANQWYIAQHGVDAPPDYANQNGFLNQWTEKEIKSLELATWVVTRANVDGGGTESFQSKIVLPSTTEMGDQTGTGGNRLDIFNNDSDRDVNKQYWLRNPFDRREEWSYVVAEGGYTDGNSCNQNVVKIYPRPLCKPVQTTLVSAQPDGDGCYTLV